MKHTLLLLAVGVAIGAAIANQNKKPEVTPDPVELIIEKSKQTMKQAAAVSQRADQKVLEQVQEMKQTIEVLVEEKEQLVEQVKVMEDEIVAVKDVATAQPFDVLAIVSDTASRK